VAYVAPRLGIAKRIRYVARGELSLTGTDRYVVHRLTDGEIPPLVVSDAWGIATGSRRTSPPRGRRDFTGTFTSASAPRAG